MASPETHYLCHFGLHDAWETKKAFDSFSFPSHDGIFYTFLLDAPLSSLLFAFYLVDARQFQSRGWGIQKMVFCRYPFRNMNALTTKTY